MFYLINSGKTCLFLSLVGFLKNANCQKSGLQPRCCIVPLLWGGGPPKTKNSLRMSFLRSGEIEKNDELKKWKVETQDICVDIVYSVGIKNIYIFLVVWKFFNNFASDNKKCIIF